MSLPAEIIIRSKYDWVKLYLSIDDTWIHIKVVTDCMNIIRIKYVRVCSTTPQYDDSQLLSCLVNLIIIKTSLNCYISIWAND